jgi:hypothetical protein
MGPDCGTAVVGGVGLGFANVVRPGPVAWSPPPEPAPARDEPARRRRGRRSRTALGVGGRDLSEVVGGRSTRAALAVLDGDRSTELIVVLGKPPAPAVAAELAAYASTLDTSRWCSPRSVRTGPDLTAIAADVLHPARGRRARLAVVDPVAPDAPRAPVGTCGACSAAAPSASRRRSSRRPSSVRSVQRAGPSPKRPSRVDTCCSTWGRTSTRRPAPPDDRPRSAARPARGRGGRSGRRRGAAGRGPRPRRAPGSGR